MYSLNRYYIQVKSADLYLWGDSSCVFSSIAVPTMLRSLRYGRPASVTLESPKNHNQGGCVDTTSFIVVPRYSQFQGYFATVFSSVSIVLGLSFALLCRFIYFYIVLVDRQDI
jgi:hypothetical protein